MASFAIGGQSSGDFRETSGRVQLFHVVTRNSVGLLAPDAFTQINPPSSVATLANKSTALAGITKVGVLGGTVAFTRGDVGNNYIGGATSALVATNRPLGIFLNDALGNAFENTPGVASGRAPYVCGSGSCIGVSIYETKDLNSNAVLPYAPGDLLFASKNGLLTNSVADNNTWEQGATNKTIIGVVKVAPDANSGLLVFDLRI
jgi:hypothetical protein